MEEFDQQFYKHLIRYPQDVIPTLDAAVNEVFFERFPAAILEHRIQVRPFNAHRTKNMRALDPVGNVIFIGFLGLLKLKEKKKT